MTEKSNMRRVVLPVICAVAAVLAGVMLFLADSVFGNPVSKAVAANRAEKYISTVYPGGSVDDAGYNVVYSSYDVSFTADNYKGSIMCKGKSITDRKVSSYYEYRFNRDFGGIKEAVETDTLSLTATIGTVVVANGEYDADFEKLTVCNRLLLTAESTAGEVSEEESRQEAVSVFRRVLDALDNKYNVTRLDAVYKCNGGVYSVEAEGDLSAEQLAKRVEKSS